VPDPIGVRIEDPEKGTDPEPIYAPVDKSAGGPDVFGHSWIDSDDAGGPAYSWIDISGVGTEVVLEDDDTTAAIAIGFDFPFYENAYSDLYINSNGVISFGQGTKSRTNSYINSASEPNDILAVWWDDLNPEAGGNIYYYYDNGAEERFIVSFVGVANYASGGGTGSLTFQAILYPGGKVTFQYGTMDAGTDDLLGASVGIEDATGTDRLVVVSDAAYMHSNLAINFSAGGWMTIQPRLGSLAPDEADTLEVVFDAAELDLDTYTGQLNITSNDPADPEISIPVSLDVVPQFVCGNVDNDVDNLINLADILYLISNVYADGDPPDIFESADVDSSGTLNLEDILLLIGFVYSEEPPELNCP
jgi:hypothetical protein